MAALSDQLLVVTILVYLVAMVCHAAEYSLGGRGAATARRAGRPAREPVAVGAELGGGGTAAGPTDVPAPDSPAPDGGVSGDRVPFVGWAAIVATALAALVHLAVLVTRGAAADRMPWGNMYEFTLSITFVGTVAWLFVLYRHPPIRHLGVFFGVTMVLLLGITGLVLYTPIVPLVPALNSYWFIIHVSTIAFSSGVLLLGFVPAVMFLIRAGYERGKRSFPYSLGRHAPNADVLERMTFRLHAFAFPIFTFAVIAGAVWAEAAWGRAWGWDPKEVWAFISWVIYAGYLHARATPSVKRNIVAWIAVVGFLTMLMNLFGVNFFFEGLHSYASVD